MNNSNYITITEVNKYIKEIINDDLLLKKVYLKGEISNFKAHSRGHYYFTLKDENSRIAAVMFSFNNKNLKFVPYDGMKVLVTGKIDVYESSGSYQVYVEDMMPDGIGALYVAFEELKKKLQAEGLFDKDKKKKIRRIPKVVGIVTSPTGAAIKDILTTIKRRYPICETILFPALVQGEEAARDIASKIRLANEVKDIYKIDTLIVGRGGGSLEDLWPFNEEVVARAIYNSRIPVISAVGHEVDWTISDFVADLRAATPTAAAELAVVDINTVMDYLMKARNRSYQGIVKIVNDKKVKLNNLSDSYILKKPSNIYEVKEQKLDMLVDRLNIGVQTVLERYNVRLFKSVNSYVLNNPNILYYSKCENFKNLYQKLNKNMEFRLLDYKTRLFQLRNSYVLNNPEILYKFREQKLVGIIEKLEVLNPLNTLKRGYTIVRSNTHIVNDIKDIKNDDELEIEFKNGKVITKVTKVGDK